MQDTRTTHGPATVAEALESARQGTLLGRRCRACGSASFTDPLVCKACRATDFERFASTGEGEVVTFTIVGFPAEPYAGKSPYAFIIARMAEGALAAGWVPSVKDPRQLPPGTKVRVARAPDGLGLAFEIC